MRRALLAVGLCSRAKNNIAEIAIARKVRFATKSSQEEATPIVMRKTVGINNNTNFLLNSSSVSTVAYSTNGISNFFVSFFL